jgi:hypothetical protein
MDGSDVQLTVSVEITHSNAAIVARERCCRQSDSINERTISSAWGDGDTAVAPQNQVLMTIPI